MLVPCGGMGGVLYATVLYGTNCTLAEISLARLLATYGTELIMLDVVLHTGKTSKETSGLLVFSVLNEGVSTLPEPTLVQL